MSTAASKRGPPRGKLVLSRLNGVGFGPSGRPRVGSLELVVAARPAEHHFQLKPGLLRDRVFNFFCLCVTRVTAAARNICVCRSPESCA